MPIYPPRNNPDRKVEILNKRIFEFKQRSENNENLEKLENIIEKVRVAKLNLLKAKLNLSKSFTSENESDLRLIDKLKKETLQWEKFSYDEIKDYCNKVDI